MSATVVRVFWCRLNSLGFCCKCNVSANSLVLLTLGVLKCFMVFVGFQ